MAPKTAPKQWRAVLERNAAFDHTSAVVLNLLRRREAGRSRQRTTAEIMADYAAAQAKPPEIVRHASGRTHVATLSDGRPYRCRECGK